MPRNDERDTDLHRLAEDIGALAHAVGAPCDPGIVNHTLDTFQRGFRGCPVELRTTTVKPGKTGTELSFRYVDPRGSHDPYQIAVDSGALRPSGRPVDLLLPELQRRFRIFGYGVDAGASTGLEKIWPLFDQPRALEEALTVTSLPPSVARSEPWLRRHRLTRVNIIAADYRHASTNLYFPSHRLFDSPDALRMMITELGFPAPTSEILRYDTRALITNVSYSWRTDSVERLCFYSVAHTVADLPGDAPLLRAAIAGAPAHVQKNMFIVGSTYGRDGGYTKLELDYTGTSVPLFQRWVEKQSARSP
jgi:hypothetical protein